MSGFESTLRFLLLPSQVGIVLLLEFLNSFRSFGLRFVLYNYITNEYAIGDSHAGALLGIKGFVDIGFGLMGSILVDIVGVRRVSIVALSVALVGRTLLAFGRTKFTLYLAMFLFSPCGDALLSVGLYRVALKKLTTPNTRPLAFAISYATSNLAGALADISVDKMRSQVKDLEMDGAVLGGVYTPMRQFIIVTWIVVIVTFIIASCFLEDLTVIDPEDLDDEFVQSRSHNSDGSNDDNLHNTTTIPADAVPAKPMVKPCLLKRWFPNQYRAVHTVVDDEVEQQRDGNGNASAGLSLPNYKMYKTIQSSRNPHRHSSRKGAIYHFFSQLMAILRLRNTWMALIFGFATFTIAMQWAASEIVLPPFLERRFGESIPIYTIQSINLFGCLLLPPIVASLTTGREDFQIVLPGLWLMALSPIFVALSPNVLGACIWQVVMTVGEVFWSPRQDSWTAALAPNGMEGLFFAVGSARAILGPLGDFVMGLMNEKYNTNCSLCRDSFGHFCQNLVNNDDGTLQCASVQENCELFLDATQQQTCPTTCIECPTWQSTDPSMFWWLLILTSIATPLSVWFFLPLLRGKHDRQDEFYGLFSLSRSRLLAFCGAPDDTGYGHVDSELLDGQVGGGQQDTLSLGDNVELI